MAYLVVNIQGGSQESHLSAFVGTVLFMHSKEMKVDEVDAYMISRVG